MDPHSINDPQVFDFDFMMYNTSKQMMADEEAKKILFCVNIENPNNDIKVIFLNEAKSIKEIDC